MNPEEKLCPKCGSAMWNNIAKKASGEFSPKGPDYTCKSDRTHVIWPPRGQRKPQSVSTYNGDSSFTEDAGVTRQRIETETWQAGKLESIPSAPSLKDIIIAREAAGNALGRLYAGTAVPVQKFTELVDELATYYIDGKLMAPPEAESIDPENPMPWEEAE